MFPGVVLNSAHFPKDHAVAEGHEDEGTREGYDTEKEEVVPVEGFVITRNECHVLKNKYADCLIRNCMSNGIEFIKLDTNNRIRKIN